MKNIGLFFLLYIPILCYGKETINVWNFYTADEYLNLAEDRSKVLIDMIQRIYIAGMNDALGYRSKETQLEWIYECSSNKSIIQLHAIYNKWLKEHPEYWHWTAVSTYYYALANSCGVNITLPRPSEEY